MCSSVGCLDRACNFLQDVEKLFLFLAFFDAVDKLKVYAYVHNGMRIYMHA
jgi:hypothetical protein